MLPVRTLVLRLQALPQVIGQQDAAGHQLIITRVRKSMNILFLLLLDSKELFIDYYNIKGNNGLDTGTEDSKISRSRKLIAEYLCAAIFRGIIMNNDYL